MNKMNEDSILVVFDGTSAYITPAYDFNEEEEEVLGIFNDFEEADNFCNQQNEIIQDK